MSPSDFLALERKALERSFKLFVRDAWEHVAGDPYIHGWHVDVICDHLQALSEDRIEKLLVNMPPGFAKSTILSVLWPAWVWTWQPTHRFLSASYSMDLSQTHSRQMRELVKSDWYQARWPIQLKADQNEKTNFENSSGGYRKIRAMTSLTGARGDTVIIDDPHSFDASWSDVERSATVQTFKASLPSRFHDRRKPRTAVVMQRFHEEDVSGYILSHENKLGYTHLCMPHEYELGEPHEPTALGWVDPRTKDGELLFPEFMNAERVAGEKEQLGPVDWAGQHQQRPTPREQGVIDTTLFKRFKLYKKVGNKSVEGWPKGCNFYMTSDHATGTKDGDFNVFRMWGYCADRNLWLVDSFRENCDMFEAVGAKTTKGKTTVSPVGAMAMIQKWKPIAFFPEDDNNWKTVRGFFENAMRETGLFVPTHPITPHGNNKIAKAQSYINLAHQARIYLPEGAVGDRALDEYRVFPNGRHDDQVDADSMIGRVINKLFPGSVPDDEEEFDWESVGYGEAKRGEKHASETFFII
ncbi:MULTISPECIES: hypothetical protein [Sphingomonas]|uniref:hypothetical protein n=1 Tax=Sphingomonas TaxID=13687 RepID=UPI00126A78CB|nr:MULTISPECIES: hypothetical protein [Sphingomonas]